ncbi:Uncharacterised protein [Staphylococcus aureus]|nr:Uncharacterised protein [Staphylococcus aureus]
MPVTVFPLGTAICTSTFSGLVKATALGKCLSDTPLLRGNIEPFAINATRSLRSSSSRM